MSAITIEEDLYQAMLAESRKIGTFGHGNTYAGHPVGAAIGVKTLEIYERDDVFGHVRRMMTPFWARLDRIRQHVPKVALRTAFIVGFPGETEAGFAEFRREVQQVGGLPQFRRLVREYFA